MIHNIMDPERWFYDLVGFEECDWDFTIETIPKNVRLLMGEFTTPTLKTLKDLITEANISAVDETRRFVVQWRDGWGHEEMFDTSARQFHATKGSMFQVASNFDCLERGSPYTNVKSGRFLSELMVDTTQGPSAAGGTGPSSILKLSIYCKNGIDLLDETNLKPKYGKLKDSDEILSNINAVKIGLQTDAVATYDRSGRYLIKNLKGVKIDQVYTSTCICGTDKRKSDLAQGLLTAAYDGTYLAAVYRQTKTLVLTMIGGGCFHNNTEQIIDAIANAHKKYAKFLHPECEVILPLYIPSQENLARQIQKAIGCEIEQIK